jgi:hypothetical protein
LFLKLEELVTGGEGQDGKVLGGRPVTDAWIGEKLGLHRNVILRYRQRLAKHKYIEVSRTPHGYITRVRKSKKWALIRQRREARKEAESDAPRPNITGPSDAPNPCSDAPNRVHVEKMYIERNREAKAAAASSAPLNPWKALGTDLPMGVPRFQALWGHYFSAAKNENPLSEAMERCIQACNRRGIRVPPPFYEAKRKVEDRERAQPDYDEMPVLKGDPWKNPKH